MGLVTARHGTNNNNDYYSNGDEEERGRGSCDYHDDDEDDDEYQSLMMNKNFDNHDNNVGTVADVTTTSRRKIRRCCHNKYHHRLVTLGLLVIMAIVASIIFAERHHHYLFNKKNNVSSSSNKKKKSKTSILPVYYECPSDFVGPTGSGNGSDSDGSKGKGDTESEYHERDYAETANLISDNITEYINTFQDIQYDNWGYTYNEVKSKMYSFKSKYFSKIINELRSTQKTTKIAGESSSSSSVEQPITIYESASGIGLNLYMTLEILNDLGLLIDDNDVYVYGNEYLPISTQKSINILNYATTSIFQNSNVGLLCPGDSTKLDTFVPPSSFDIVYCGYLSPLNDPLKLNLGEHDNFKKYTKLCYSNKAEDKKDTGTDSDATADITTKETAKHAQEIQNDWYGLWISQMIYIAKPGAAIIVEEVSSEYCTNMRDWGGVSQSWWYDAISKYKWDIDNTTIEFVQDTVFPKLSRYHVYMRKNK